MASEILPGPTWAQRVFVRPFLKGGQMYRPNGHPHGQNHQEQDREQNRDGFSLAYQNRRISVRDLDLPTLLKGIRDIVIIGGLIFSWIIPTFRPAAPPPSISELKTAFKDAFSETLDERDMNADPDIPAKQPSSTKQPQKPKPRQGQPAPSFPRGRSLLQEDGLKAIEPYNMDPSIRAVSYEQWRSNGL